MHSNPSLANEIVHNSFSNSNEQVHTEINKRVNEKSKMLYSTLYTWWLADRRQLSGYFTEDTLLVYRHMQRINAPFGM